MKQYGKFKLGVLLLASAGLASCSSDDTFSGSKGQSGEPVKTQFAISVPVGKSGRLSQAIVQGQDSAVQFRGMNNINLISFNAAPAAGVTGTEVIKLGSILDNELEAGTNAKVYYEVRINPGVSHFLFYGEAYSATDDAKTNGALTATVPATVNDIKFELKPISTDAESNGERTTLLAALNLVAQAKDASSNTWASSTSDLKPFYDAFIRLKAGSAASIKQALDSLEAGITATEATTESDLKTAILNAIDAAQTSIEDCTYPRNVGLPDGAAQLKFEGGSFSYINSANVGNLSYTSMANFVYPASLYYMANTDIKTADTRLSDRYSTNWETCLGLYSGVGKVTATTQSVALVQPVKYAVGRFDVAAKFSASSINDNVGESIAVTAEDGITLDGILIGGQKNADWQFAPLASSEEYTIYDASVTSTKLGTADIASKIMAQSLALSTTAGTNVNFALELTNNTGNAFTGVDGIVPDGAKFYLVGKLVPQADKADNHVFAKAYNTKANVTISSLAHAYNCIPDLKNPKLELGLSVKLEWTEGLVQDVTID